MSKVRVTIKKRGRIPYIGNGPVIKPIYISQEIYETLIKLGYPVVKVDTVPAIKTKVEEPVNVESETDNEEVESIEEKVENNNEDVETIDTEETEETVEEDAVNEEVEGEAEETEETVESIEEAVVEETILLDDPEYSAGAFYTEEFAKNKTVCKAILDARKAEYADNASLTTLKKLVNETNPEVEGVEF